jgi:long-chain fatty acid transport protein
MFERLFSFGLHLIPTALIPAFLNAQGFQVNFQGQKQQGMGSVGTALAIDGSSLFFNPGAASFVAKSSVNAGFTPVFANILFEENNTSKTARTNSPMATPFSFYGLYKKNEESKLAYGLAVYTPFGSTVQWEDGWMGRFAITRLQLRSIFFQPTVSYKINEKLGVGAGFIICSGKVNLQKDIPVQFPDSSYANAELAGSAMGLGANVGIYYTPNEQLSFGLSYRSQVNMSVSEGQATFNVPSSLDANFPDGTFSSSLPLPQVASFGVAYSPNEKLKLAFDVNYVGWKAYDTLAFDYAENTASLIDTKSARAYENIFSFRLGGQYLLTNNLALRLGASYGITPVQDGYVTPETPDANRFGFTGGLGYKLGEHFEFDASVLFVKVQRTDTNSETGLSGTFTTIAFAPGLSLIYNF